LQPNNFRKRRIIPWQFQPGEIKKYLKLDVGEFCKPGLNPGLYSHPIERKELEDRWQEHSILK
jgi:hypothetical protein